MRGRPGRQGDSATDAAARAIVSSGFGRTHMTIAAHEAGARRMLAAAITGAYPTSRVKRSLRRLGLHGTGRLARLLERDERIPDERLRPQFSPELLFEAARALLRIPVLSPLYPRLSGVSVRLYGRLAARQLARNGDAGIYHFRAGFGLSSVPRAQRLGLVALCDQSAVHPQVVDELLDRRGRLEGLNRRDPALLHPLWRAKLIDIEAADAIVVNSDLLKEMFVGLGEAPERIHVIHLGVDDHFLRHAAGKREPQPDGPLRLIFAGRLERDKGADELAAALAGLEGIEWELAIAGPVPREVLAGHREFFGDPRVTLLGTISRAELARRMRVAPVFVFPSFAEGSARVVSEALACGCYVITTANAGSIVEDGVHGALVPPGEVEPLREAIRTADQDRHRLAEIGNRNAELIASRMRQADYGDALAELYRELTGGRVRA